MPSGHDCIMVLQDYATKSVRYKECKKTDGTRTIMKDLTRIFATTGFPLSIVSDRDPRLTSIQFKEWCQQQGIQHITATTAHHTTNGLAEKVFQTLQHRMRMYSEKEKDWTRTLPMMEFAYNANPHGGIGISPFELNLGYIPRSPLETRIDEHNDLTKSKYGNLFRKYIAKRDREIGIQNEKRSMAEFREGEKVWLEGEAWRRTTLNTRREEKQKLSEQRGGP